LAVLFIAKENGTQYNEPCDWHWFMSGSGRPEKNEMSRVLPAEDKYDFNQEFNYSIFLICVYRFPHRIV